jgi:hypothetical protein
MAQVFLMSSLFTHRYDSADHFDFGDKPLVVLSAEISWGLSGATGLFWRTCTKQWWAQHENLARLSSRGVHRVIEQSGHSIQLEKPQTVIDAVNEVLQQLPAALSSSKP